MRAKRSKQYRKLMQKYALNFGFRTPYQVLLDADIIKDASGFSMHLGKNLESALSGETKPMITQCCIRHLYDHEPRTDAEKRAKDAWIEVAKAAERRRCGHHELEGPLSALECLESVVDPKGSGKNKHRYVVASQDSEVRARMRKIAGVPLIYLKRSVMILEPMAGASEEVREREEKEKVRAGLKGRRGAQAGVKRKREDENEDSILAAASQDRTGEPQDTQVAKRKKTRGPKGPNPLSIKKSKKGKEAISKSRHIEGDMIAKEDPKAADGPMNVGLEVKEQEENGGMVDGPRKRKRKRKVSDNDGSALVALENQDETM